MTQYAVEYRKGFRWNQDKNRTYRYMECKICGQFENVSEDTTAVTCHECVMEMCDAPEIKTRRNLGRPSGWHFMKEFVDKQGNVYFRGVEQPKLKGTKPPTIIEKKVRYTKKEKQDYMQKAAVQVNILKKELKGLRWKKDKKVVMQKIKNYSKIMNGKVTENLVTKLFS
tara:strand:- start:757 stop:1263 length:507 start_codon:yes stop_codon:yes gene_type:complete